METIEVNELKIRIIRTSRKRSILMRVGKDGMPEILSPKGASRTELKKIALANYSKLKEYSENFQKREAEHKSLELKIGSELLFFGKNIKITARDTAGYDMAHFYIPNCLEGENLKYAVIEIYKSAARDYLNLRVPEIADKMGLIPSAVKVNSAKTHWASCSARGNLNFSWYLMMAEPSAIDYVIIHELCHMKEFNHSPKFWQMVSRYCPDYADKKMYLKELFKKEIGAFI